jgi:hypothetical protein
MKFPKKVLKDLAWGETPEGYGVVRNDITGNGRWSIHHQMIFRKDASFYETSYSVGATENQEEHPYDYSPDEIECEEVVPREVTVIEYVKV